MPPAKENTLALALGLRDEVLALVLVLLVLLAGLPAGEDTVYAYKSGFKPAAKSISINAKGNGSASVTLNLSGWNYPGCVEGREQGDVVDLGEHKLRFLETPHVHH